MAVRPVDLNEFPLPQRRKGFVRAWEEESDVRNVPPIFAGEVRLADYFNTARGGMTAKLALVHPEDHDRHPFKGLPVEKGGGFGQLLRLSFTRPLAPDETPEDSLPIYTGDGVLVWWAEDPVDGMRITVGFPKGVEGVGLVHPFEGMPHGKKGEVMTLIAWAVADDGRAAEPRRQRARRPFHQMPPTAQAHTMFADERFGQWVLARLPDLFPDLAERSAFEDLADDPHRLAEAVVKKWCGILSCKEFGYTAETDGAERAAHAERARERWTEILGAYEDDAWGRARP